MSLPRGSPAADTDSTSLISLFCRRQLVRRLKPEVQRSRRVEGGADPRTGVTSIDVRNTRRRSKAIEAVLWLRCGGCFFGWLKLLWWSMVDTLVGSGLDNRGQIGG